MEDRPPENITEWTREHRAHNHQQQGSDKQTRIEESPPQNIKKRQEKTKHILSTAGT